MDSLWVPGLQGGLATPVTALGDSGEKGEAWGGMGTEEALGPGKDMGVNGSSRGEHLMCLDPEVYAPQLPRWVQALWLLSPLFTLYGDELWMLPPGEPTCNLHAALSTTL